MEELILEWLNMMLERWLGGLLCKCTMLVVGSFRGHVTESVRAEVNRVSDLVIPNGVTKLLQPLDVVINWPFRFAFKLFYNQWMTTTKHELTPSSRMKLTLLPMVCEWIPATWCSVSSEISSLNEMDGSEDFMISDIVSENESE
jgi:hypothetical protein